MRDAAMEEPYLSYFAGHGREAFTLEHQGKTKVDVAKVAIAIGEGETKTIRHQVNKAQILLDIMDAMGYGQIDAIFVSEAAIHGLIAVYMPALSDSEMLC